MEKRGANRIKISLKAERISGDKKHGVFIENISESGMNIIIANEKTLREYFPGNDVDLRFHLSSGEALNLHCRVRWFCPDSPPDIRTESIGLEIIDPPPRYIEFVRTLT
ncbi:MAG TPA: PilZ domain-containing protein [Thermodesulfovibrionales bacterium]|nr:PilZ domain-containing protein [Thermodesulfovibrionales bacterium]